MACAGVKSSPAEDDNCSTSADFDIGDISRYDFAASTASWFQSTWTWSRLRRILPLMGSGVAGGRARELAVPKPALLVESTPAKRRMRARASRCGLPRKDVRDSGKF